ncbi:MAG: AIR synthase-related protein, partial [Acidobacteriota bacterium]
EMDLDRVPLREAGMTPSEIMLSESQERMLLVAKEGRQDRVMEIFKKWDLEAAIVGRVTADGHLRVRSGQLVVVDLPAQPLAQEAPVLDRPRKEPAWLAELAQLDLAGIEEPSAAGPILRRLLASPNLCSRRWITEQYDTSVGTNTVLGPGGDAAIIRIKGTSKALALTSDCNPRYCFLDPAQGAALAVAEAALNISCVGGTPLAVSDCLNFGNPERLEIMWQFQQAVSGLGAACRALETPVVSGNVSFYNETEGKGIHPVPTVAMVGLLEEVSRHAGPWARESGDRVLLLGETRDEMGGSEYLAFIHGLERGRPPFLDLRVIRQTGIMVRESVQAGRVRSAHDLSEGGLAVALAEACFGPSGLGMKLHLPSKGLRLDTLLFGESSGRVLLTARPSDVSWLEQRAARAGLPLADLGEVGGDRLHMAVEGTPVVHEPLEELRRVWEEALSLALEVN